MKKFTTCNTSDKKNRYILRMLPVLTVAGALSIALTGCGTSSEDEVQRYSWPLATASPEDTVTQIFAEKFAEEVADLSDGKMKIRYTRTPHSVVTATCLKPAQMEISRLSCRILHLRFLS